MNKRPITKDELIDFAEHYLEQRKFGIAFKRIVCEILAAFWDAHLTN